MKLCKYYYVCMLDKCCTDCTQNNRLHQTKQNLHCTRVVSPKCVTSGGAHLRGLASGQHISLKKRRRGGDWRAVDDTVSDLTDTVSDLTDTVSDLTDTVSDLTDTVSDLTDTVSDLTDTVSKLTDTVSDLTDTVSNLRGKIRA